jgi:hypothetical protein
MMNKMRISNKEKQKTIAHVEKLNNELKKFTRGVQQQTGLGR